MDKKGFIFKLILAIVLSIVIIGGTFAYIFFRNFMNYNNEIIDSYSDSNATDQINGTQLQDSPLIKICGANEPDVYINKCGDYYQASISGYNSMEHKMSLNGSIPAVTDASMDYYNANGDFLIACGGYQGFTNEEEREANIENCAKIDAVAKFIDCERVLDSCFDLIVT